MFFLSLLQTMRKKFFVLRCESSTGPARLEYFDSEKKFRIGSLSKRTIDLKTCFNINKKSDSKHKHAIALYTRDDCFPIVADDENALNEWLQALLLQQQVDADGVPVPTFGMYNYYSTNTNAIETNNLKALDSIGNWCITLLVYPNIQCMHEIINL